MAPVINFTVPPDIVPPPCLTRSTHTVRVTSKNGKFFADIEILDAFTIMLPNNFQMGFTLKATNPNIIDNTGDGNGRTPTTNPGGGTFGMEPSRLSHMQRITSPSDPSAFFDIEVLDSFTITGPNKAEYAIVCPGPGQYPFNFEAKGALPAYTNDASGRPTIPLIAAVVPSIIDNTGAGFTVPPTKKSTRAQHVMALARQVTNGNSGTIGAGEIASTEDFTLILLMDALVFNGPIQTQGMPWQVQPNSGDPGDVEQFLDQNMGAWFSSHVMFTPNLEETILGVLYPSINTIDKTKYVIDPVTGQKVPPAHDPKVDPNVYIFFPDDTESPFLGGDVCVDMGPLWWIRQLGTTPNVWFWYLNKQQPMAFSFFGIPPEDSPLYWAYRGFTYLPDFPVSWIQAVNYPLTPLGVYGSDNLEEAAVGVGGTLNWYGYGISPMCAPFPPSTTVSEGGDIDALDDSLPTVTYTPGTYLPYGAFDLVAPPSSMILAVAKAAGLSTSGYTDYGGPTPNIWEITGYQQPPLKFPYLADGKTPRLWDKVNNPYLQPSIALAKQVVAQFVTNWNAVANALNTKAKNASGSTSDANLQGHGFPWTAPNPPGWQWALPYGGDSVPTAQMFNNSWVPSVLVVETVPCYIPTISADQLDPTVWDLQTSLDNQTAPQTWASEKPPSS